METYFTEKFIVYFDLKDQYLINLLVRTLQEKLERILQFFGIDKLSTQTNIYIYSDKEKYFKHVSKYIDNYQEWMIGDTYDGNINMLSFGELQKIKAHKEMSLTDYTKVVVHELVHICQQEVNPNAYGCEWFWEALATNLSEQTMFETIVDCTKEQLMFDYLNLQNGYQISYTVGKYILENYSHERLLSYIVNPEQLWNDTEMILSEVKNKR